MSTIRSSSTAASAPAATTGVGIVLQSRLRRTLSDIADLAALGPEVRLCKGIYLEPAVGAFQDDNVIRRSFLACLDALIACGSRVGIATHDECLISESLARVADLRTRALRVPDAARCPTRPGDEAGGRRPPRPDLRAVRTAVVRVLVAAAPGEPCPGGNDRQGDDREGDRNQPERALRRGASRASIRGRCPDRARGLGERRSAV